MQPDHLNEPTRAASTVPSGESEQAVMASDDALTEIRHHYEERLLVANLRLEAIKSGMIDLDGLKLLDRTGLQLDKDDKVVGGETIMSNLRRDKPWLFAPSFSSSTSAPPRSQPMRQKMASEMTDEEYLIARAALTGRH